MFSSCFILHAHSPQSDNNLSTFDPVVSMGRYVTKTSTKETSQEDTKMDIIIQDWSAAT